MAELQRAAAALATAQQTTTGSAVAIAGAPTRAFRRRVVITNTDATAANSCWVGNAGVAAGTGVVIRGGGARDFWVTGALYVIDNGSTHVVIDVQDEYEGTP